MIASLVLALYRAWVTSPVTIYGKKRPCSACLTTLQFATSIGLKIAHNLHPGGFWATSSVFLNELVLLAIKDGKISHEDAVAWLDPKLDVLRTYQTQVLGKKEKRKSLKTKEQDFDPDELNETGYDTPSDSETED